MADRMLRLAVDANAARELGRAGRERVIRDQALNRTIEELQGVLASVARHRVRQPT
jgi:hypothetical protein